MTYQDKSDENVPRGGGDVSGKSAMETPRGGGDVSGKAASDIRTDPTPIDGDMPQPRTLSTKS